MSKFKKEEVYKLRRSLSTLIDSEELLNYIEINASQILLNELGKAYIEVFKEVKRENELISNDLEE